MLENSDKAKNWEFAFGLNEVDDLEPSSEMQALVEKEIIGEISKDDILKKLKEKYNKVKED